MFKKDDPPQQPSKLSVLFASILVIGFFFVYLSDGTIINYYREFSFSEGVFYTFVALPVLFCFLLFFSFPYALFIYFLILSILNLFFDHKRNNILSIQQRAGWVDLPNPFGKGRENYYDTRPVSSSNFVAK